MSLSRYAIVRAQPKDFPISDFDKERQHKWHFRLNSVALWSLWTFPILITRSNIAYIRYKGDGTANTLQMCNKSVSVGLYSAGFVSRRLLRDASVPTVRDSMDIGSVSMPTLC